MKRFAYCSCLILWAILAVACSNPAADKPKAITVEASDVVPAKPEGSEALRISSDTSKIAFVAAKVTAQHDGSFARFSGTLEFVAAKPENSVVRIDIDLESVTTDAERLTGHLKSADFFDVAKFPSAKFISTAIKPNGSAGAYLVTGNFDLHGVRKSITFPATLSATAQSVTLTSEFSINRKDFDINYPGKMDDLIRDDVLIRLNVSAPRGRA